VVFDPLLNVSCIANIKKMVLTTEQNVNAERECQIRSGRGISLKQTTSNFFTDDLAGFVDMLEAGNAPLNVLPDS